MDLKTEQTLVKQAQNGNREALGKLWDEVTPKLFGYLINTMRDKALAEDLLQSAWLKATLALPKYEPRGIKFSAWLFAIARNECKLHWRKGINEVSLDDNLHDTFTPQTNQTENSILVEQLLKKLQPEDRELIQLRYISDLPLNDIAKILNINFVAVRVRLHRALAKARKNLNS